MFEPVAISRASLTPEEIAEAEPLLSDPLWRIRNLYRIINKYGQEIPFVPTAEQDELLVDIFVHGILRHAILKARQMGFSTLIAIVIFDQTYFHENISAAIVDQDQEAASKKLAKIKFAYEGMGPLSERLEEDNSRTVGFANGSIISAGKKARGSTNQILHISEWGPIAHDDPKRSEEIQTGALPSAENGLVFVETTFKGGKGGHLYALLKRSMETPEHLRTRLDFKFRFCPWYKDKSYTLEGDMRAVPAEVHVYLNEKEKELGITFTDGQRLWYAVTKKAQGIFMWREYPTTVAEALSAPVEGAIYGHLISQLRAKGRIIPFERDHEAPVFSVWDVGWDDSMSVWLFQVVGLEVRIIWHTRQRQVTAADMKALLDKTGIPISGHVVPHDAGSKSPGEGKNFRDYMGQAGFINIIPLPRVSVEWDGINAARSLLPRCWFNSTHCQLGLEALEAFHTKDTTAGGIVVKDPVHDWSSHDSAAFRYIAEALQEGAIKTLSARKIMADPLMPDGSTVDLYTVQLLRRQRRSGKAKMRGPTL